MGDAPFITLAAGGMQPEPSPSPVNSSMSDSNQESSPASSISITTHDISRTKYHMDELGTFAARLEKASASIFPNKGRTRYKDIRVLLLRWEEDTMGVQYELDDLAKTFRSTYRFETEIWVIPTVKSLFALNRKAWQFIEDFGNAENLLIVYYAGHGLMNGSRQALWTCKSDVSYASLEWYAIQPLFERAESDVLLILDCCAAASGAPAEGDKISVTETIAACGFETWAPQPGRHSFTNTLIAVLDDWQSRSAFTAAMLHCEILNRLRHEKPEKYRNTKRFEYRKSPIHIVSTADPKARSVELAPRLSPDVLDNTQDVDVESCRGRGAVLSMIESPVGGVRANPSNDDLYDTASLTRVLDNGDTALPEVLIALRLEEDQLLDFQQCRRWLQDFPALAKYARVQGVYKSNSSLLLISVPVVVWDWLPDDPACSFVGYVHSLNILENMESDKPIKDVKEVNQEMPLTMNVFNETPSLQWQNESKDAELARFNGLKTNHENRHQVDLELYRTQHNTLEREKAELSKNISPYAYRAHKDAAAKDQRALLEMKGKKKWSWVGLDDKMPYAYLREAMVSRLMDQICKLRDDDEPVVHVRMLLPSDRREKIARAVGLWDFSAHDFTDDELLYAALLMLQHALTMPELKRWWISTETLTAFLVASRSAYNAFVPFHNFRRAVDILQAVFYFLIRLGRLPNYPYFSSPFPEQNTSPIAALIRPSDALTLLITAIGLNVGHPGVNNVFLVTVNSFLAQLYSDRSVLESFHCAAYSQILRRHWPEAFSEVGMRKLMISLILATDMRLHFDYLKKLGLLQEKLHENGGTYGWTKRLCEEQRTLACELLIKCANISNVARKYNVAVQWTILLNDEFTCQASIEKELGIPSALFAVPAREIVELGKSQISFINIFAMPLFQGVTDVIPEMGFCVDELRRNQDEWQEKIGQEGRARRDRDGLGMMHGIDVQPSLVTDPVIMGLPSLEEARKTPNIQRSSDTTEGRNSATVDWRSQATSASTSKMPLSPSTQGTSIMSEDSENPEEENIGTVGQIPTCVSPLASAESQASTMTPSGEGTNTSTSETRGTVLSRDDEEVKKPSKFRMNRLRFWKENKSASPLIPVSGAAGGNEDAGMANESLSS